MRLIASLTLLCLGILFTIPTHAQTQPESSGNAVLGAWAAQESYFPPIILIEQEKSGTVTAYLIDTSLNRVPFSTVAVQGDSVMLALDRLRIRFRGVRSEGAPMIKGTYTQGDASVSLTLVPADETLYTAPRQPQHPVPPFPYISEDISFRNPTTGIELAGTLTLPIDEGPHPAVVLIHGSGPMDRDATVEGHKPFLVLADHLTRNGIAVLRYDKRGGGRSGGNLMRASLDDLAQDAAAALRYLMARPEIDVMTTGLIGHSEGGLIAPLVLDQIEDAAFLILLASPGVPLHEGIVAQNVRLAVASGAPEAAINSARSFMSRLVDAARSTADSTTVASQIRSILEERGVSGEALVSGVQAHTMPLFRDLARFDPTSSMQRIEVSTLVIFGTKDLFVPPDQNEIPTRSALSSSPSNDVTIRVINGLNHWLQPADTGLPNEISQIETTVATELLVVLTDWIHARTSGGE